jgi:dsRNA-specific ribonuclease
MERSQIEIKMYKLEEFIGYRFSNLSLLADAMNANLLEKKGGKNNKEYSNDAIACLGDTIIKFLITEHFYRKGKRKGDITIEKTRLEKNEVFHEIADEYDILKYAYNDKHFADEDNIPKNEKVRSERHDPYIEAIAAAIYLDGGWEKVSKWFEAWLLPKLEQHKSK